MLLDAIESDGAIGVDIGGHGLKAVRVTSNGVVVDRGRIAIEGVEDRRAEEVEASVRALVEALDPEGHLPVGVGVPGFHDQTTGLLRQSPNFPGWEDRAVGAHLRDLLGRRVATENDANCALLGEAWTGAARGVRNVAMITLGTGVGTGFLVGGTLLTGARGAGGEGGVGPTLNGQTAITIADKLMRYKNGETLGAQSNLMWAQASQLSVNDIDNLAAFIETL